MKSCTLLLFRANFILLLIVLVCKSSECLSRSDCRCQLTNKQQVPWQVSVECPKAGSTNDHLCSGVIINSNTILTTADCVSRLSTGSCSVRVGLSSLNERSISYKISGIYAHPTYSTRMVSYGANVKNVGLITIRGRIRFVPDKVGPACLNLQSFKDLSSEKFSVSAWDSKMGGTSNLSVLKMEDFQAASRRSAAYGGNYLPARGMDIWGADNFFGEQGAPLMYKNQGKWTVEGLASHKDDKFTHDPQLGYSLRFTRFIRPVSSKQYIKRFVGREYCRG